MPAGRFKHLKCLKILDLGRAKLEELDSDAFLGLEKLQLLSVSENLPHQFVRGPSFPSPNLAPPFPPWEKSNVRW